MKKSTKDIILPRSIIPIAIFDNSSKLNNTNTIKAMKTSIIQHAAK